MSTLEKEVVELNTNCSCTNEDETPSSDCFGCYDDSLENLHYLLENWKKTCGFTTDTIRVDGKGMGWSKDSGYAVTSFRNLDTILIIRGDYRIVFTLEGSVLTAERFSHDEPMGGAVFTFTPVEEEEN